MNIYQKLQEMRVNLQALNIKKSGENKFAGYKYYELADIMPPINQLQKEYGTCSFVTFGADEAVLTIVNAEKPDEMVRFASPMKEATLKGAHAIQNLGAVETYQRRYLYMAAFEIVEADVLDATQGKDNGNQQWKKPDRKPQKPQQQKKLPDDLSDQLNTAIKMVKQVTGSSVKEVVTELEMRTGIKMDEVTVETAQTILAVLDEMAGAELPF